MRIALAQAVARRSGTEAGFIILDEVLGSQHRDRRLFAADRGRGRRRAPEYRYRASGLIPGVGSSVKSPTMVDGWSTSPRFQQNPAVPPLRQFPAVSRHFVARASPARRALPLSSDYESAALTN